MVSVARAGDLTKDDIADDFECPLKVISGIFIVSYLKKSSINNVQSQIQRSDVTCEQLLLYYYMMDCYMMLSATC